MRKITAGTIYHIAKEHSAKTSENAGNLQVCDSTILPKYFSSDPIHNAELYLEQTYGGKLFYFEGLFYGYNGKFYVKISKGQLIGEFERKLVSVRIPEKDGFRKLTQPEIRIAWEALTKIVSSKSFVEPAYLDGKPGAEDLLVFPNGILNLKGVMIGGRNFFPLAGFDPNLFITGTLAFDYDPTAGYDEFLEIIRGYTGESGVLLLQEFFGYALTYRTDLQKCLAIIGPSRSGKSTIARIIIKLLGAANVANTTLNLLASDFGLSQLIGKKLAVIGDTQQIEQKKRDTAKEAILNITGEDPVGINQKHKSIISQKLPCKLLIVGNKLPSLIDNAGALSNRIIVVPFPNSFAGNEDPAIERRLDNMLPGIMNWAFDGLHRLFALNGGKFTVCEPGLEYLNQFVKSSNPMVEFIDECCVYPAGHGNSVTTDNLYAAYQAFCCDEGRPYLSKQHFFTDLKANAPHITQGQERHNGRRRRFYRNIALKEGVTQNAQPYFPPTLTN